MDEQQANQAQPTDPVVPAEQPATPQTDVPTQPENPQEAVSPEQDFMNAYLALCKEKGYELAWEVKPLFNKETSIYDLSKVSVTYSVAKTK